MKCVDLKKMFERNYRIATDPAAGPRNADPWYWIIPGRRGEIYPAGGDDLCVMTGKKLANLLRSWPELTIKQDADGVVVFRFHLDHFAKVAARVGARKRRRLSPEHRKTLTKVGSANLKKFHRQRLGSEKQGKVERSPSGSTSGSTETTLPHFGDVN